MLGESTSRFTLTENHELKIDNLFFELLQVALGTRDRLSRNPDENEWSALFALSQKQTLIGFTFFSIERLSWVGQKPPQKLLYEWIAISEQIKQQNASLNKEAVRLSSLFSNAGLRSMILKGQANARLYVTGCHSLASLRQAGDIDIYIEGGREYVLHELRKLRLIGDVGEYKCDREPMASYHHVDLPNTENGISVEVHYMPSSGLFNPFNNKKLQTFLKEEAKREIYLVEEGFYVPNIRFALVMQLAHIMHHVIDEGVGFRQVIDYYFLLKSYSLDKKYTDEILRRTGMVKFAGALMWVMQYCLKIDNNLLIVVPNERRGRILLERIMQGGNFGHYQQRPSGIIKRYLFMMTFRMKVLSLCPSEVIWCQLHHIWFLVRTIPARIQRRKMSLREDQGTVLK